LSLQIVQELWMHWTGLRLAKSTIFRMGDGTLAERSWREKCLAEMLARRSCKRLLEENSPLSSFCLAWKTGLQSVRATPGLPVSLVYYSAFIMPLLRK
jgi:hypothetical protein